QKFEEWHVVSQYARRPVWAQRMEEGGLVQHAPALAEPGRGAELQGQRQKRALGLAQPVRVIDVVPKVTVRRVLKRLRLHHIAVTRIGLVEQRLERQELGDVWKQRA